MDFFEATQETMRNLNPNEREIYDFVIKNMNTVKQMSIHKFAAERYVSSTTIFRFTQTLGFKGYANFIDSLRETAAGKKNAEVPGVVIGGNYGEVYLKNAMEAVRVMSQQYVTDIVAVLARRPSIYILCDNNTHAIGQYCEKLFIGLGFRAYFPEAAYQMQTLVDHICTTDMIIALSYSGDPLLVDLIQRIFLKERPYLMSITRADNNVLELMSDANFYVFAEEIRLHDMDLTSAVPMLMVLELLVYEYVKHHSS